MNYDPPFEITNIILNLIQNISKELGFLSGAKLKMQPARLRKNNRIRTIQSSLAIEGNSLSIEQITAILEGKRVIAPKKDLVEVTNAINVYDNLKRFDPLSLEDFLKAHGLMMSSLIEDSGRWRTKGVGIIQAKKVSHIAPPAGRVPTLMKDLFNFLTKSEDVSWLIKACVFHYELEFIHPFLDGNGRMGRLWQQVILMKEDEIFEYLPIEALIKDNQTEYYQALSKCDMTGKSTLFIEFMLQQILFSLTNYSSNNVSKVKDSKARLELARIHFKDEVFSRKDYILFHKDISTATASRDLKYGLSKQILVFYGVGNQTSYKFIIS